MLENIEKVFDDHIRPQLRMHNGDVEIISFEDGILRIRLVGKCSKCPSSWHTTESFIEGEVKKYVPTVSKVSLTEVVSDELLGIARYLLNKKEVL